MIFVYGTLLDLNFLPHILQTIVLVVDSGEGFNKKMIPTNIMNLNIGKNVDLQLPPQFWLRLTNKLGKENLG